MSITQPCVYIHSDDLLWENACTVPSIDVTKYNPRILHGKPEQTNKKITDTHKESLKSVEKCYTARFATQHILRPSSSSARQRNTTGRAFALFALRKRTLTKTSSASVKPNGEKKLHRHEQRPTKRACMHHSQSECAVIIEIRRIFKLQAKETQRKSMGSHLGVPKQRLNGHPASHHSAAFGIHIAVYMVNPQIHTPQKTRNVKWSAGGLVICDVVFSFANEKIMFFYPSHVR